MKPADPNSTRGLASGAGTLTPAEAIRRSIAFFQNGNLDAAERLCRVVLSSDSNCFDALHLLGMVAARRGRLEEADRLLRQALRINTESAEARSNHGNVLRARGHFAE